MRAVKEPIMCLATFDLAAYIETIPLIPLHQFDMGSLELKQRDTEEKTIFFWFSVGVLNCCR